MLMETQTENKTEEPKKNIIERAQELAEIMDKKIAKLQEENDRLERLQANELLAGRSIAGTESKKEEETPTQYINRLLGRK